MEYKFKCPRKKKASPVSPRASAPSWRTHPDLWSLDSRWPARPFGPERRNSLWLQMSHLGTKTRSGRVSVRLKPAPVCVCVCFRHSYYSSASFKQTRLPIHQRRRRHCRFFLQLLLVGPATFNAPDCKEAKINFLTDNFLLMRKSRRPRAVPVSFRGFIISPGGGGTKTPFEIERELKKKGWGGEFR